MHMKDLDEALKTQINVLGALMRKMNCANVSDCLYRNRITQDRDFLKDSLKALNTDIRSTKFAEDIGKTNPRFVGIMRKSSLNGMDLMLEEIAKTPSKRAKYRRLGLMPYDVERNWYLNRFNRDVSEITKILPPATENPEYFVKCSMKLFDSFARNIRNPYGEVYRYALKNILGANAKNTYGLTEEIFSLDGAFRSGGRAMSDIRFMRKAYREKKYAIEGTSITFDADGRKITHNVWDLMFGILFMQMKIVVLSSVFCLVDVEKMIRTKAYLDNMKRRFQFRPYP